MNIPPPPTGFEIEQPAAPPMAAPPQQAALPPPEGFEIEQPPEGFEIEQPQQAAPPEPLAPEEFSKQLKSMMDAGRPLDEVRNFVTSVNYTLTPETDKWLDENYADYVAKGPQSFRVEENPDSKSGFDVDTAKPPRDIGRLESAWLGLQSGALRGFDDELEGFAGAVGNKLGSTLGLNDTADDVDFWSVYEQIANRQRADKDAAFEQNPISYGAGFIPGSLTGYRLGAGRAGGAGGATEKLTRVERAKKVAAIGAAEGAIGGAGNADGQAGDSALDAIGNRLGGAAEGAAIGAVAAPVVDLGVQGISAGGRAVWNRFGPPKNSPNSGLNVLNDRMSATPEQMRGQAAQMREVGVEPRLVDLVGDDGRTAIRNAAQADTPARMEAAAAADEVYAALPERVAAQADNIAKTPLTSRQITAKVAEEQQSLGPQFDAVRDQPVQITPDMAGVLSNAEGRAALRRAAKWLPEKEEKAVMDFIRSLNESKKLGSVDEQAAKLVPGWANLSAAAKQQVLPQLGLKDGLSDATLSVDVVDKWARAINEAAKRDNMFGPAKEMVDAIRGAAREQHPSYDDALNRYAAQAQVGDAAAGTGRFEGTDFLRTPPEQFTPNIRQASETPAAVSGVAEPLPPSRGSLDVEELDDFGDGTVGYALDFTTEAGDSVPMTMTLYPDGVAEMAVNFEEDVARVGVGAVRDAQRAIQEQFPEITSFTGIRTSGAGAGRSQRVPAQRPAPAQPTVSEADAIAARARDTVQDRALENGGRNALSLARDVASGPNQRVRNAALLGGRNAERLERGLSAEVARVDNTAAIDPRAGNQARIRDGGRDAIIDGFRDALEAGGSAAVGSRWGVVRVAGKWLTQAGIRNVDAERLTRDAISKDPARVDAAIAYLEQRGMQRARAEQFVSTITAKLGGRAGTGKEDRTPAPNSVRALYRDGE